MPFQTIYPSDNPNEGRIKINSNFSLVNSDAVPSYFSGGNNITIVSAITSSSAYTYGVSLTDNVSTNSLSATTLIGGTISSGGTDLYSIFLTAASGNDITRVQPGTNTYTGGTANNPTINISGGSFDNISISGNTLVNNLTATTISANTIAVTTVSAATVYANTLSATTISGSTLYSGSTNLYSIFSKGNINGYNVLENGLIGDGTTNNTSALNTLISAVPAGSQIYFPPGTYLFSTNVNVTKQLFFTGTFAIIKITANAQIFQITTGGEKTVFTNLTFSGNSVGTSQFGLYFNDKGSFLVDNCLFYSFGGGGIAAANIENSNELGGIINACKFSGNNIGVSLLSRGEYVQITNSDFISNTTGILTIAGNTLINGNNINYNATGIEIGSGTNNAHGIISNNQINHNTVYGLNLHDFTQGQTIANNHILANPIIISNTFGVHFIGGQLNNASYFFNSNTGMTFSHVSLPNSLANTISLTGNSPQYIDCYNTDGRKAKTLSTFFSSANTSAATAYTDIQGADLGAASLRIRSGVKPTVFNNGEFYNDGSFIVLSGSFLTETISATTISATTLVLKTGSTKIIELTEAGNLEFNSGNGTGSQIAIHQNAVATTIMDVYNNSYSKLLFRISDNGVAGQIVLANSTMELNSYTNNVGIGIGAGSPKLRLKADSVGQDILSISPAGGAGGVYFNNDVNNNPYFYLQPSAGTGTNIAIYSSGFTYFNGGNVGFGSTAAAQDAIHIYNGTLRINDTGSTYGSGKLAVSDANGSLSFSSTTELGITGGTYTPTLFNVANLSGSTGYTSQYMRVGSVVTVSGKALVAPEVGTSTITQLEISLPIASNLGATEDCSGTASPTSTVVEKTGAIIGSVTNNRALMDWQTVDVTHHEMFYHFTYRII